MVNSCKIQLDAIQKGFRSVSLLNTHLDTFSHIDLRLLFTGKDNISIQFSNNYFLGMEFISSSIIKDILVFRNFPKESKTPDFLKQVLDSMSSNDLKRFLLFITEQGKS